MYDEKTTHWKTLYDHKGAGWFEICSDDNNLIYAPKEMGESLSIISLAIKKNEGTFTCSVTVEKGNGIREARIKDKFKDFGGKSPLSTFHLLTETIITLKTNHAEEMGRLLLTIHTFHLFDEDSKNQLLLFIGLAQFEEYSHRSNCLIS